LAEVRYHFDEHMPRAVTRELRRRGIDVETTVDARLRGATDYTHLGHAHAQGRVVATEDVDYRQLHDDGYPHSGIAYFSGPRSIGEMVELLVLLHASYTAEEMVGRLEWL
jgi:hypothetical protein